MRLKPRVERPLYDAIYSASGETRAPSTGAASCWSCRTGAIEAANGLPSQAAFTPWRRRGTAPTTR